MDAACSAVPQQWRIAAPEKPGRLSDLCLCRQNSDTGLGDDGRRTGGGI
jgi:hypothetical protein